jgi:hypothetical protein
MPKEPKEKQHRPSYETGKLRDPRIEEMQDRGFQRGDFTHLLRKATKSVQNGPNTSPHNGKKSAKPTG